MHNFSPWHAACSGSPHNALHSSSYYVCELVYNAAVLVESVSLLSATGIAGTFLDGSIEKRVTVRLLRDITKCIHSQVQYIHDPTQYIHSSVQYIHDPVFSIFIADVSRQ